MKPSKLFRKASELVFKGKSKFACFAILDATSKCDYFYITPESEAFARFFQPEYNQLATMDDDNDGWFGPAYVEENQLARQLALLFMAEMSKDLEK